MVSSSSSAKQQLLFQDASAESLHKQATQLLEKLSLSVRSGEASHETAAMRAASGQPLHVLDQGQPRSGHSLAAGFMVEAALKPAWPSPC